MAEITDYWLTPAGWVAEPTTQVIVRPHTPSDSPAGALLCLSHYWKGNDWGPDVSDWTLIRQPSWKPDWETIRTLVLKYGTLPYSPNGGPLDGLRHPRWDKGTYSFCTNITRYERLIWEGHYATRAEALAAGTAAYRRRTVNATILHTRKDVPLTWDEVHVNDINLHPCLETLPFHYEFELERTPINAEPRKLTMGKLLWDLTKQVHEVLVKSGPCPYVLPVFEVEHLVPSRGN